MAGPAGRREVPDVVREVAAWAGRDAWWGVRPVIAASHVDDELAEAITDHLPGAWVVRVPPAERPLREAVDGALRAAGAGAPDTRRYDELTAAQRPRPTADGTREPVDRRRVVARRERWKHAVEPVGLLWIGVASLGASLMSAANVEEFGRGDLAWNVGTPCLFVGVSLMIARLAAGLWRLIQGSVRAVPTERELARAFLRDLRYDARRLLPTGWFRARDVPEQLPVLIIARSVDDRRPALLDEYLRWHSPRLPRFLWWLVAALRRPTAVVVTDVALPVATPGQLRALWRRRAEAPAWWAGRRRWLRQMPASVRRRWCCLRGPAWRRLSLVALGVARRPLPPWSRRPWPARWLRAFLWPPRARPRILRLTAYTLLCVLAAAALYLQQSPGQPYCLRPMSGSTREVSTDDAAGEWIGYRTCLGWRQLVGNIASATVSSAAARLTVHRPGPDDTPDLFDPDLIYRENKRAERLAGGLRPLITVAVVTSLTSAPATRSTRSVVAEREGLAGAYAAQRRINAMRGASQPYVRLAVVNTGDLTAGDNDVTVQRHLASVTTKLRQLAADPTLAAAIITANSTVRVQKALAGSLASAGVPMLSPTMSADGFGEVLARAAPGQSDPASTVHPPPVFFQLNSTNDDQVQLIYEYARGRGMPLIFVFPAVGPDRSAPDRQDLYLRTLYCDVRRRQPPAATGNGPGGSGAEVGGNPCTPTPTPAAVPLSAAVGTSGGGGRPAAGPGADLSNGDPPAVPVTLVPWSPGRPATEAAGRACPPEPAGTRLAAGQASATTPPLVFFGGRYTGLAEFAQALRDACGARMPPVAVSDSAARFLTDRELARRVPHGLQVLIAYEGRALTTCGTLRALRSGGGASPPGAAPDAARGLDFYEDIREYLGRCAGSGDHGEDAWLSGGWAAFSYDALLLIDDALLRADAPDAAGGTRGRILRCLRGPNRVCDNTDYLGVYGTIHLGPDGVGHPPAILLRIKDLTTAFDGRDEVSVVGTCLPGATSCGAEFPP